MTTEPAGREAALHEGRSPREKPGATARRSPTRCNPEKPASSREDPAQPRRNGFYKLVCHGKMDGFLVLKAFSDELDGDINECDFGLL